MLVANLVLPLSLAASAAAAAANPFMPANLAVRFKSEKQQPRADTVLTRAQKKAALAIAKRENKKLSGTEDLVALLASAHAVLYGAQASASASASAKPTASAKPSSHPSHRPSASPSSLAAKQQAKRDLELVLQTIHESNWEDLDTRLLCPASTTACPILPSGGGFECIDTQNELESCGGCIVRGEGEDCTALRTKGALGVGCQKGQCHAFACTEGYALYTDSQGRGRCKKNRTPTV